eukprot:COSAG06_NODE_4489_length_4208_cov_40.282064_3_plen_149_part_00
MSCNQLLILAGNTYCDRLWCVWELYVFFSTSGARALDRVQLQDFSESGTSSLQEFDVANSHCFSPVDEAKLRGIIDSGGTSDFNNMIREGALAPDAFVPGAISITLRSGLPSSLVLHVLQSGSSYTRRRQSPVVGHELRTPQCQWRRW